MDCGEDGGNGMSLTGRGEGSGLKRCSGAHHGTHAANGAGHALKYGVGNGSHASGSRRSRRVR